MEKRHEDISRMFNRIARRYDLLNHLLSLGIDRSWRNALVKGLIRAKASRVIDVATGTADLAILAAKYGVERIDGVDIATAMLDVGREKIHREGLDEQISLVEGKAEDIPFPDDTFDAAMVAFGVRNFEDLHQGLCEMRRVIRPGGDIFVLEFSIPRNRLFRAVYFMYFKHVLPRLGGWISGDRNAYSYLPASVKTFPQGAAFIHCLEKAGFHSLHARRFNGGIASLYHGSK